MRVICIDDVFTDGVDGTTPRFGEKCTASQCNVYPDNYDILEHPCLRNGILQSFAKRRFIPVSDIDETEMQRNYKTEKL